MLIAVSWGVGSKRSTSKQLAFELGPRLSIWRFSSKRMFLAWAKEGRGVMQRKAVANECGTKAFSREFRMAIIYFPRAYNFCMPPIQRS